MNSASRLLKVINLYIDYSKINHAKHADKNLQNFFSNTFNINCNDYIIFLNTQILILKKIRKLKTNIIKIKKESRYHDTIKNLESLFINKLPNSPLLTFNDRTIETIKIRLEAMEDLFEAKDFIEGDINKDKINEIFTTFDTLISKLENLNNQNKELTNYIEFLKTVKESLKYYKLNGSDTLEKVLEKLICRSKALTSILNTQLVNEVSKDLNYIIGSLYSIYKIIVKYPNKAIEYANKQYLEHKN